MACLVVLGLGAVLLLGCTNFVAHCRAVWRLVVVMWAARAQLYGMALVLSDAMLDRAGGTGGAAGGLGAAALFEAPPPRLPRLTKAEKKAARRGRRMPPPVG